MDILPISKHVSATRFLSTSSHSSRSWKYTPYTRESGVQKGSGNLGFHATISATHATPDNLPDPAQTTLYAQYSSTET